MADPFVRSLYLKNVQSDNIKYGTWPAGAAGVAMVSDGAAAAWAFAAYVTIIAIANVVDPSWLIGTLVNIGVVETHYGDYAIAQGAAGAEVDQAVIPYATGLPAATALTTWIPANVPISLPYPVRIIGSVRMSGRIRKSTAASAAGFTTKAWVALNVGT